MGYPEYHYVITYFVEGAVTKQVAIMSGIVILPTIFAIWLGGVLTRRVKQSTFLKFIYIILIVSGIVLLITNL